MLDVRIMACRKRETMAKELAGALALPEEHITWDDRPEGGDAMYTARKTWLHPMPEGVTHRLVLQDDVIPCDGLLDICEAMIQTYPRVVFALTTFCYSIYAQMDPETPYYPVTTPFPACAIIFPREYIEPWIRWCDEGHYPELAVHDSHMIRLWCQEKGVPVLSTVPQLVDHRDDETLLPYVYHAVRKSPFFSQHPEGDWGNRRIKQLRI